MHVKRLQSRILKAMNRANRDFALIEPGDRILVALSGGKDSYGMLWGLKVMQAAAPFRFDVFAYHLDQGQPGHDFAPLRAHLDQLGVAYEIETQDTYTRVVEKTEPGKIYCSLCSRFRRAILYKAATRNQCNKVALGHHREDLVETLFLNIMYSGQIKSMPPRLVSDDGAQVVIRPLVYVPESELQELAVHHGFPILPCRLCGSIDAQRQAVKRLLKDLSRDNPHLLGNALSALGSIRTTHVLDRALNPYLGAATADPEGTPQTPARLGPDLEDQLRAEGLVDVDTDEADDLEQGLEAPSKLVQIARSTLGNRIRKVAPESLV